MVSLVEVLDSGCVMESVADVAPVDGFDQALGQGLARQGLVGLRAEGLVDLLG